MLAVRRFREAGAFAEVAEPFLMRDEARHNLELGIVKRLVEQGPSTYGDEAPYLAVVEADGEVAGIGIRTPPFNLVVAVEDAAAIEGLARDARERFPTLPGVMSDTATAAAFAATWHGLTGREIEDGMPQRIYCLTTPPEIPDVPGSFRDAARDDRDLLVRWVKAFAAEALPDAPHSDAGDLVDGSLRREGRALFLWEDGGPVSLAGFGGSTPNGSRVGPVYTPPHLRGRGYASACVATLSRRLLAEGNRFLFLFTDLGNPASNHVYRKMGYEPVCDMQEIRFRPA